MKKVTLSMPVYNVARFVEKSLLSALNQTYKNIEFLIIDDKSTDESMNIVRQVINSHPRKSEVRVIDHIVNKGLGDTRNTSIKEATGDYIYFMDSDDVITPDCIERLVAYMNETPVDFIASSRIRKSFDGEIIANDVYVPAIVKDKGDLDMLKITEYWEKFGTNCIIWIFLEITILSAFLVCMWKMFLSPFRRLLQQGVAGLWLT